MKPIEQFSWCLRTLRVFLQILSMDIFIKNYQYTLRAYLILLFYVTVLCCFAYNILFTQNLDIVFRSLTFFGAFIVIAIVVFTMKTFQPLIEISEFLSTVYESNSEPESKYNALCSRYATLCQLIVKFMAPAFTSMCCLMAVSPFIEYFLTGKMSPAAGVYCPGITEYDFKWNLIVWLYNAAMLVGAACSEVPIIVLVYISFLNVHMMSRMLVLDIDELQEIIETSDADRFRRARKQLIDIIYMEKKYNEIIDKLKASYSPICNVQYTMAAYVAIMCIYVFLMNQNLSELALLFIAFIVITSNSVMGTILEISGERFYGAIRDLNWYMLSRNEIQVYQILLHHCQQPKVIFIADIKQLNMDTCLSTLKTIYSFAMILYSAV